jgi:hypothetical protein
MRQFKIENEKYYFTWGSSNDVICDEYLAVEFTAQAESFKHWLVLSVP